MIERRMDSIKSTYSEKACAQVAELSNYLDSLGCNSFSIEFSNFGYGFEVSKATLDGQVLFYGKSYQNELNKEHFLNGLRNLFFLEILNPILASDKRQFYSFTMEKNTRATGWNFRHSYSEADDNIKETSMVFDYSELSLNIGYRSLISFMKRKGIEKITGTIDSPFEDFYSKFSAHLSNGEISEEYVDKTYPIAACLGGSLTSFLHHYFSDEQVNLMPKWRSTEITGGSVVIMKDGSMTVNFDQVSLSFASLIEVKNLKKSHSINISKTLNQLSGYLDSFGHSCFSAKFINYGQGRGFDTLNILVDGLDFDPANIYRGGLSFAEFSCAFSDLMARDILKEIEIDRYQEYNLEIIKATPSSDWEFFYDYSELLRLSHDEHNSVDYSKLSSSNDYCSIILFMKNNSIEKISCLIDSPTEDVSITFIAHFLDGSSSSGYLDKVYPIDACSGSRLSEFLESYCIKEVDEIMPAWTRPYTIGGSVDIMNDGSMNVTQTIGRWRRAEIAVKEALNTVIITSEKKDLSKLLVPSV